MADPTYKVKKPTGVVIVFDKDAPMPAITAFLGMLKNHPAVHSFNGMFRGPVYDVADTNVHEKQ